MDLPMKNNFFLKLVNMCCWETLPTTVGGDFNVLRSPDEKNNTNYSDRWSFLFNAIIDGLNLRELNVLSERKYTRANSMEIPTHEKLDRILMTTEWEHQYPLSTVIALSHDISDHTPLLLNT
jgi:endonuclease/exonuclease/phosphatase family metal-dependent hydrolase